MNRLLGLVRGPVIAWLSICGGLTGLAGADTPGGVGIPPRYARIACDRDNALGKWVWSPVRAGNVLAVHVQQFTDGGEERPRARRHPALIIYVFADGVCEQQDYEPDGKRSQLSTFPLVSAAGRNIKARIWRLFCGTTGGEPALVWIGGFVGEDVIFTGKTPEEDFREEDYPALMRP